MSNDEHTVDGVDHTDVLRTCPVCSSLLDSESVTRVKVFITSERNLIEESERRISLAQQVSHSRVLADVLHDHKLDLINLANMLNQTHGVSSGRQQEVIKASERWIRKRIDELRSELGRTTLSVTPVNLNHLIQASVRYFTLHKTRSSPNIEFVVSYNLDLPLIVVAEVEMLTVINNLLSNAWKAISYTSRAKGQIDVITDIVEVDDIQYIQILIRDDGIGIRESNCDKMFTRGFTTWPQGVGMGLYLVREIVEDYGGQVSFESLVGQGATFIVQLPLGILKA